MRGGYRCAAPGYGSTSIHRPGLWVGIFFAIISARFIDIDFHRVTKEQIVDCVFAATRFLQSSPMFIRDKSFKSQTIVSSLDLRTNRGRQVPDVFCYAESNIVIKFHYVRV